MNKSLKRLVIDSATPHLYIALYDGYEELDAYYEQGHNDHSVKLMSELEEMLNRQGLTVKDLEQIIVGVGPGSYTGLRVGVVIAKMFGWTLNLDVYAVSSLSILASSAKSGKIISAVDARRGNAFLALFERKNDQLVQLEKEQLTNLEAFEKAVGDAKTIFSGKPDMRLIFNSSFMKKVDDIHQLNPNYLRLTEAEKNVQK